MSRRIALGVSLASPDVTGEATSPPAGPVCTAWDDPETQAFLKPKRTAARVFVGVVTVFVVGAIAVGSMQGAKADRLARVRAQAAVATGADALQAIIDRGRQRGVLDDRPIDELLGYDQFGLPS